MPYQDLLVYQDGDSETEAARQYGVLDTRRRPVTTASNCTAIQQPRNGEMVRENSILMQALPMHVPAAPSSPHGFNVTLSDAGQLALVGLRVGLPLEQQE